MSSKRLREALAEKADNTNDRERAIKRLKQLKEQYVRLTEQMKRRYLDGPNKGEPVNGGSSA